MIERKIKLVMLVVVTLSGLSLIIPRAGASFLSSFETKGTVRVAKWAFDSNVIETNAKNIDLSSTINPNSPYQILVPGSYGQFDIELNAIGNDLDIMATIALDNANVSKPSSLKFYVDSNYTQELNILNEPIPALSTEKIIKTIYWKWNYTSEDESYWNGSNIKINFKVSGSQS